MMAQSPPMDSKNVSVVVSSFVGNPCISHSCTLSNSNNVFNTSSLLAPCVSENLLPCEHTSPIPSSQPDSNLGQSHKTQSPNRRTHSMTTRSMNQIFKPKQLNTITKHPLPQSIEPTCVTQALFDPHWHAAMSGELTALMRHGTWDLVPSPKDCNLMGFNWVFRVKRKVNGSIDHFKA